MPSENVATINRIYKAFEDRDFPAFWRCLSPEVRILQSPELPWGGVYNGLEEAKLFFGKINAYIDNQIEVERTIDGVDRIAMIGRTDGTVRETGHPFDIPVMHLWELQNRLATRLEIVVDVPSMQAALQARA